MSFWRSWIRHRQYRHLHSRDSTDNTNQHWHYQCQHYQCTTGGLIDVHGFNIDNNDIYTPDIQLTEQPIIDTTNVITINVQLVALLVFMDTTSTQLTSRKQCRFRRWYYDVIDVVDDVLNFVDTKKTFRILLKCKLDRFISATDIIKLFFCEIESFGNKLECLSMENISAQLVWTSIPQGRQTLLANNPY